MGLSLSANIADEMVKALISNSNSVAQTCAVNSTQIQSQTISGVNGGTFVNNWSQYTVLSSNCNQQATFQNSVNQTMQQQAQQLAKSIAQQFQLSSSAAFNLTKLSSDLAIQVSNSYIQNCYQTNTQEQLQLVTGTTGASVYNNWQQYNQQASDCALKDAAVNNTVQEIQQTVQQTATATVENTTAIILGLILAIFSVIGIIYLMSIYYKNKKPEQSTQAVDTEIATLIAAQKLSAQPT